MGVIALLVLVALLLTLFTGLLIHTLPQVTQPEEAQSTPTDQGTVPAKGTVVPLFASGNQAAAPLQLPSGHAVIYETQQNKLYIAPMVSGSIPQPINASHYTYNSAVSPLLTSDNQLLYGGSGGVWLTGINGGVEKQIATFPTDQVITSLVLSSDGSMLAWSTEPQNGSGSVKIYVSTLSGMLASPAGETAQVYQQSAATCPCFRVFSFLQETGKQTALLLTDDRGDHHAVRYGLWSLALSQGATPQALLPGDAQQGPLALAPSSNALLYSTYEGLVPAPLNESSVPENIGSLSYANSLYLSALSGTPPALNAAHVLLPAQHELSNSAEYHWVTTPLFSPDGQTLVYIVFSGDAITPFARHSALYTVQMHGTGTAQLRVGKPQLLATSISQFVELGSWLDSSTLTFFADGALYAIDVHSGAVAGIVQIPNYVYAHIIAVVKQ